MVDHQLANDEQECTEMMVPAGLVAARHWSASVLSAAHDVARTLDRRILLCALPAWP